MEERFPHLAGAFDDEPRRRARGKNGGRKIECMDEKHQRRREAGRAFYRRTRKDEKMSPEVRSEINRANARKRWKVSW